MPPIRFPTAAAALLLMAFAALGSVVVPAMGRAGTTAPDATIAIDNFTFAPPALTVTHGTRVVWVNRDDIPHTVVSADGPQPFKSPALDTGDRFGMIFDRPGLYRYFCSIHPMMTGTITVR